jgi:hypothetical protein
MYSIYDRSLEDESPTPTTSEAESIVKNLTQVNINDEVAGCKVQADPALLLLSDHCNMISIQ